MEDLRNDLEAFYHWECSCGKCQQFENLAGFDPDSMSKDLSEMVNQIWKDQGIEPGTINREVTSAFASQLWNGVLKGYGETFNTIDYNTPDFNTLASLRRNVWQFSAAKNYQQLRELSNALIGEDGKLRSKSDFFKAAAAINDQFDKRYGATEYELAVAGGQMAGKWVDIQASKSTFPYLEFDAVMDRHTTALCAGLNGTLLPVDHPFWKRYYPPNHFGCRSTVRQQHIGQVTPADRIPGADIPKMFQVNLGQSGLIFPPKHPYFTDIPAAILNQSMAGLRKELFQETRDRLKGKTVPVENIGDITFSSDGFKEIFNQPHADYMFKNQLAYVSDLLLKNSTLVSSSLDAKGRDITYHYLKVDGLPNNFLVVREYADGRKVLYSIIDKLK